MPVIEGAPVLLDAYLREAADASMLATRSIPATPGALCLSVEHDLAALAAEWRAFEAEADCTVFQTFAWQSAWMRHIAPHERVRPAIVLGRTADGTLAFIAPLAIHERRGCRVLVWLASDLCDYNVPLLRRDFAALVGADAFGSLWASILALLERDPGCRPDAVLLEKMPSEVGGQPNPFHALRHSSNPSGAHETRLAGTWDDFYRQRRSSATRRHDRTKRKRLGEFGEVGVTTLETAAAIGETLSTLYEQKGRAFDRMGVTDLFRRPGHAAFFREFACDPANRDLVHVSRLDVGGRQAAANFGLVFKRRYYHVLAAYDDGAVAKYGPGATHLLDVMRHAIERGCDTFDFTIGDEPYKRNWSDRFVRLYDHRSARTVRGFLVTLPAAAIARVKRTVKESPRLWHLATRIRAAIGGRAPTAESED